MDEKENIIKYYSKTGESLTNLTGFSLDTRVGATANAFVLLKFLIKELLQLQLSHQKINYYSTLIRVTSLSCEKVHRTFSTAIRLRESEINSVFASGCCTWVLPPSKRRKAPTTARTRCPCRCSNPSECNKLHPPPFAREAKMFIYIIRRSLAALSKSKNSVSCETLHILDTRVGATTNAFVLLKFSIKELLQLQQRMLRLRQPSGCYPYR